MGTGKRLLSGLLIGWLAAAGARGAITITCMPDQFVVAGDTLVTVECHIQSTDDVMINAVQIDFPCAMQPGPGTFGTAIRESVFVNRNHQNPPFLFATEDGNPLTDSDFLSCRALATVGFLEPPVVLPANEPRYVASIAYRVSRCARGAFPIRLENFNNPPLDTDLTRITDEFRRPLSFTLVTGQISAPDGCMCMTAPECNDGNPCTADTCSGGFCRNIPNTNACDDGLFCFTNDRCQFGLCTGTVRTCETQGFLYCREEEQACLHCQFDFECSPSTDCRQARCSAGECFEIDRVGSCDDGLFCTTTDFCANGECVGTGSPCKAGESCDEETLSCLPFGCPDTSIQFSDPPTGIIDARRPHPPWANDIAGRTGIGGQGEPIFLHLGVGGAQPHCFDLEETAVEKGLGDNIVASVTETEPRIFQIFLARPITSGAVTRLFYVDGSSTALVSHPGNVNIDGFADGDDVVSLMAYLTNDLDPPFGVFSFDVDHSGEAGLPDLIALIDVLNGADLLTPWMGTPNPK